MDRPSLVSLSGAACELGLSRAAVLREVAGDTSGGVREQTADRIGATPEGARSGLVDQDDAIRTLHVDLLFLGLQLVLSSVETLERAEGLNLGGLVPRDRLR